MKYVVAWKLRPGGSAAENEASAARLLEVYSKWAFPGDATVHQFVIRVDGEGGFTIQDRDDMAGLALSIAKLTPFLEYTIYPVLDAAEGVSLFTEAIEFRNSVK